MRRALALKQSTGISLFPFLAVLICTLGAMIVLLLTLVRDMRVGKHPAPPALAIAASNPAKEAEEAAAKSLAVETEQWKLDMLRAGYREQKEKQARQQQEIGHLEERIRDLQSQWQQLRLEAIELEKTGNEKAPKLSAVRAELQRLRDEVDAARRALDDAKRQKIDTPSGYRIVPYNGPNGTRRRAIYIECLADRVILQPEGTTFKASDFSPHIPSASPLAAALRATREYYASQSAAINKGEEPYPLLIVRASGAEAYSAARTSLESWDAEFGYELVSDELPLKYAAVDPALADVQQRAADAMRRQRVALIRAAPARYGRATGVGPEGDSTGDVQGGTGRGYGGTGNSVSGTASPRGAAQGTMTPGVTGIGPRPHGVAATGRGTGTDASQTHADRRGGPSPGNSKDPRGTSQPNGQQQANGQKQPSGEWSGDREKPSGSGQTASANRPRSSSQPGAPAGTFQGTPGEGQAAGSGSAGAMGAPPTSLADRRGANWAIPGATEQTVGIRRPLRATLFNEEFVLHGEAGTKDPPRTVLLNDRNPVAGVEEMVTLIRQHIDSWGIAGVRQYWKPVVRVQVMPDARARFNHLRALMEGSGIEFEEVKP